MCAERRADRVDGRLVTALAEIGNRLERQHSSYSRRREGVLRPASARIRRLVARARALRRPRAAGLGGRARLRSLSRSARSRRCARSTSRAARDSSPSISPARSSASTRAQRWSRSPVNASPRPSSSSAMRSRCRSRTQSFGRVHASFFYCHLEEPERLRFLAEARRVAPELIVFGSHAEPDEPLERWEERMLSDGSTLAGVQAGLRTAGARRRARRRRCCTRAAGSSSCARGRDVPVARSAEARPVGVPGMRPTPAIRSIRCRCSLPGRGSAPISSARRRAIVEGEERRPWRGRAGNTLRRWLGLDEDAFYASFYCASVTRCYPGRATSGRGDRTPTSEEQRLCERWRDEELRLLKPSLVVTVGGLAARRLLGVRQRR